MVAKRRRLEDLYVLGRELSVDDGKGEVVVWLQKLNPLEQDRALRKAGAAKAQLLMARRDHNSEEWQDAYADVDDFQSREDLVEYLLAEDAAKITESAEAELSFQEEWTKDGYLQSLRDAWDDDDKPLREVFAENPEDPEAKRVFDELKRFATLVEGIVTPELERLRRDYDGVSEDELRDKGADRLLDLRSSMVWLREFRKCEVWLAAREPNNHDTYYFENREAVDRLASEVLNRLISAYQALVVEPAEGKDLPKTPASSPSSEPSGEEETSEGSGLQVVQA